jgi:prepilin-type N-terminal cleavage/methylation domain-containing protein
MKLCRNNENGLTLIEVLATIAIFSIIMGLITNVVINSFNYHDKSYDNLKLGQEANLIITKLRTIHQQNKGYRLKYDTTGNLFIDQGEGDGEQLLGKETGYRYELSAYLADDDSETINYVVQDDGSVLEDEILVKKKSTVFLTIKVIDEKTNKSISLESTLTRLVGGN